MAKVKKKVKKKATKKKVSQKKKAPKKKSQPKKAKQKSGLNRPLPPPQVEGTLLGRIDDFFAHVNVIALILKTKLSVGNTIHIKGHTTDLIETVTSIQIDHKPVESAKKGDSVGIKIAGMARKRDWVFRVD